MNQEELSSTIEQIKAQIKAKPENEGKSEDEIDEIMLDGFFKAVTEKKMPLEDLEAIMGVMGYEFEEGAKEEIESGLAEGSKEGLEDVSKKELEDTRTIGKGESAPDFEKKIETVDEKIDKSDLNSDEDEEVEERKKASSLWGMDLSKAK